jgi:hypothetical protein
MRQATRIFDMRILIHPNRYSKMEMERVGEMVNGDLWRTFISFGKNLGCIPFTSMPPMNEVNILRRH